jgi:hypothetical protein
MHWERRAAVVAFLVVGFSTQAQPPARFSARLATVPISALEVPRVKGSGEAHARLEGTTLTVTGFFRGLVSPATDAHIHQAPKAMRGPVVFPLTITKGTAGELSGTVTLTKAQIDALKKANFYVQINSEKAPAPDGNLWGWLLESGPR